MKHPANGKSDDLLDTINAVSSKKSDPKITSLPRVRYPTNMESVAACVLRAFDLHATQPTFKVLAAQHNKWRVDSFHTPGKSRLSFREFAPGVRSTTLKQRMYHQAAFANVRLVANTMLAAVLEELVVHRRGRTDHEEITSEGTTCKMNVFLAPCSDTQRWSAQVLGCG